MARCESKGVTYSARKVSAGSTRVARAAGMSAASTATVSRMTTTTATAIAPLDCQPKTVDVTTVSSASAPALPSASPARAGTTASRTTLSQMC